MTPPASDSGPGNRLHGESSPYLLQHAHNPVDWYPWGEEALSRARELDRPILLSIGYSACHWCHVMEHESFSDDRVAAIQNQLFVSVKVDREERPDIDAIYMRAVQAMTGRGGWPLTAFLTPAGLPFYGGTYFPPEPRQGMPGFVQVMESVAKAWSDRRDEIEASAAEVHRMLERTATGDLFEQGADGAGEGLVVHSDPGGPPMPDVHGAVAGMLSGFDAKHGGFGSAPKFPQSMILEALMSASALDTIEAGSSREAASPRAADSSREADSSRAGDPPRPDTLTPALRTLEAMAAGGIRDQLAGGFHRYSTDARWLVPHFEKMLYDNALLARAYLRAWQLSGSDAMRAEVVATLEWLLSEMRSPDGGFFAALDADTEGEEGRFYVWSADEIREVLGDDAHAFEEYFGVREGGNWEGSNILHRRPAFRSGDEGGGAGAEAAIDRFGDARARLLEVRNRRERPFRDTKVLAAWNGMALRAFAEAGTVLDEPRYLDIAATDLAALLASLPDADGRLRHQVTHGRAEVPAFLDDVAALGLAALTIHAGTLEARWLETSIRLAGEMMDRFLDPETDLLMDTPADGERLIVRPREIMDNAVPAGNSLAAELLFRLGRITGRAEWEARARRIVAREKEAIERVPHGFGRLLALAIEMEAPPEEIAITGNPADDATKALLREAHRTHRPGRVIAGGDPTQLSEPGPLFEGRGPIDGRPAAWVCRDYSCRAPVTEAAELREILGG